MTRIVNGAKLKSMQGCLHARLEKSPTVNVRKLSQQQQQQQQSHCLNVTLGLI